MHSTVLAWRILRAEEPSGLQSMGLQRVEHDWVIITFILYLFSLYLKNFLSDYCYFLLSNNFGLSLFSVSNSLRCKVIFFFLVLVAVVMYNSPRTTFDASHKFQYVVFSFSFVNSFLFPFWFLLDSLVIQDHAI